MRSLEVLKVNDRLALVRGSKSGYHSVTRKNSDNRRCSCPSCAHGKLCHHPKLLLAAEAGSAPGETSALAHRRKQREILAQRGPGLMDLSGEVA